MRYYVIFVDECTRFTWFYPLKYKSDFYDVFVKFRAMVEKQFDKPIKIFQCDGGGEFNKNEFLEHLAKNGIVRHISCPGAPEQNGIAERKHRHIVETGLTMLFHAKLPLFLWIEAFMTAVFLINRLPNASLGNDIPFYKLYGQHADYSTLKVFGCKCFPYLRGNNKHKFQAKTFPCVFIGYSNLHKGYRCYNPKTRKVYISRQQE